VFDAFDQEPAPIAAQSDVVVFIQGCLSPLVLRPVGTAFQWVAVCNPFHHIPPGKLLRASYVQWLKGLDERDVNCLETFSVV